MRPRSSVLSLCLMVSTMCAGLAVRFAALGLPRSFAKYGGSALWALMVYWIVSSLLPRRRPLVAGLFTAFLTAAIEFLKLYHSPALDAFRLTLPGILLLGRIFSLSDIAVYWVAICFGVLVDVAIRRRADGRGM